VRVGARPQARHVDAAPAVCASPSSASRLRNTSARRRRRPAHNPGAARPQLAVDDPGLQPRRRQAAAPRLRQGTPPLMTSDRDVEGFLALLAAQRAPSTVDAYRRDLASVSAWLGGPIARATTEDIERYLAELRAAGLSAATIARRV